MGLISLLTPRIEREEDVHRILLRFFRTQKGRFPPPLFPAESYPYMAYSLWLQPAGLWLRTRAKRREEGREEDVAAVIPTRGSNVRRGEEGLSFPLLCSMLLRWANREVGERTIRWLYQSERVVTCEEIYSSRQKKVVMKP